MTGHITPRTITETVRSRRRSIPDREQTTELLDIEGTVTAVSGRSPITGARTITVDAGGQTITAYLHAWPDMGSADYPGGPLRHPIADAAVGDRIAFTVHGTQAVDGNWVGWRERETFRTIKALATEPVADMDAFAERTAAGPFAAAAAAALASGEPLHTCEGGSFRVVAAAGASMIGRRIGGQGSPFVGFIEGDAVQYGSTLDGVAERMGAALVRRLDGTEPGMGHESTEGVSLHECW